MAAFALAVAASGGLAGCGGSSSNGESKKTGPQVVADAAAALRAAGSAHAKGFFTQQGKQSQVDLRLQGADIAGTVVANGQSEQVAVVAGKQYIKVAAAVDRQQGVSAAVADRLANRWVLLPASSGASFAGLSLAKFADQLAHPEGGPVLGSVKTATLNGKTAVVATVQDETEVYVAASGKPYPLQVLNRTDTGGSLTFSELGTKQNITAPPSPLDLKSLGG